MKLPEKLQKSYKFFCRGLDIRVAEIMKGHMLKPVLVLKLDPPVIDLGLGQGNEPVPGNFIDQGLDIRRDPVSTVTVFVFCNFFAVIFTTYNHHDLCNADVISGD